MKAGEVGSNLKPDDAVPHIHKLKKYNFGD